MRRLKFFMAGLTLMLAGCGGIQKQYAQQQEEFRTEVQPALEAYQKADTTLTDEQRASWARFFTAWEKLNAEALK